MERSEIEDRVKHVVAGVLDVDEAMIEPESHFVFDLGAESVQSVELISGFEAEFNLEMDSEKAIEVQTIGGAVDFIAQLV